MKEKIYTIPLTDAFKQATDCPFCYIYEKLEKDAVEFVMGTSYMQDDVREQTNLLGFCEKHMGQMYLQGNRLGLALILQTHIATIKKDIESAHKKTTPHKKRLFGNDSEPSPFISEMNRIQSSCFVCSKIDHVFDRYMDTFFYLLSNEPEFKTLYQNRNKFCFKHLGLVYNQSEQHIKEKDLQLFRNTLIQVNTENVSTLEEDLDWFVRKFDYRYKDEPWKNSKNAVLRGIKITTGLNVVD